MRLLPTNSGVTQIFGRVRIAARDASVASIAARAQRRDSGAMSKCAICLKPIDGPQLSDPEATGRAYHPGCVVAQVPQELAVAALAVFVQVAAPTIALWAA
jgi:hypothetical protein